MLVRLCPKYSKLGSAVCERTSFRYTSWVSKRHRNHRSSCQHSLDGEHSQKAREFQKNIYFYFIDYIKAFDCVDHNKLWNILKETGIPDHLFSWEICMQVKKQLLKPDTEKLSGSKLRKEYDKAVHYHPVYLTSMQSTSCEIPGWMNHKLESRLPAETSTTSDMEMIS